MKKYILKPIDPAGNNLSKVKLKLKKNDPNKNDFYV